MRATLRAVLPENQKFYYRPGTVTDSDFDETRLSGPSGPKTNVNGHFWDFRVPWWLKYGHFWPIFGLFPKTCF